VLGRHAGDDRIAGLHTPGGCGALSLGFKLIATAHPGAKVLVGTPTWPNHIPVVQAAGLNIAEYRFYDRLETRIRFDEMMAAFEAANAGDVVLLHGCCHNPTGADLNESQWRRVVDVARGVASSRSSISPIRVGSRFCRRRCRAAPVARCLRRGGHRAELRQEFRRLSRPRRLLFIKTARAEGTKRAMGHVVQIAREMWSMPPDHGAAAVRIVLETPELRADWMRRSARCATVSTGSAAGSPRLMRAWRISAASSACSRCCPSRQSRCALREDHAIYMADSGRFNVIGMADHAVDRFIVAIVEAMNG
jgi:aromatic-amino-acid transaminase